MAILDSIGTSLKVNDQAVINGVTITFSSYQIQTSQDGSADVDSEDVDAANGARVTRLIFKRDAKATLELICNNDAVPRTDFPIGDMATLTGLTGYFVADCRIAKARGASKASVDLVNIGIT